MLTASLALVVVQPSTWRNLAACRGLDPELFYPDRGESTFQAKTVCRSCPVRGDCLAAGLTERFGIWAGTSERERRRLRRSRGLPETEHHADIGTIPGGTVNLADFRDLEGPDEDDLVAIELDEAERTADIPISAGDPPERLAAVPDGRAPRACEQPSCGAIYQPSRSDQRFCSLPCRKAFNNKSSRTSKAGPPGKAIVPKKTVPARPAAAPDLAKAGWLLLLRSICTNPVQLITVVTADGTEITIRPPEHGRG